MRVHELLLLLLCQLLVSVLCVDHFRILHLLVMGLLLMHALRMRDCQCLLQLLHLRLLLLDVVLRLLLLDLLGSDQLMALSFHFCLLTGLALSGFGVQLLVALLHAFLELLSRVLRLPLHHV